jgi:hypothetical protein
LAAAVFKVVVAVAKAVAATLVAGPRLRVPRHRFLRPAAKPAAADRQPNVPQLPV